METTVVQESLSSGMRLTIPSSILGESRDVVVMPPDGYSDSGERLPTLYQLDGYPALFSLASATLSYLSTWENRIPQMILVSIPNTDRDRDLFPSQVTLKNGEQIGGGADAFLRFIQEELIPTIDRLYRTTSTRLLYGTSNSALTAIYDLLTVSTFDTYIASSPTLSWDNNLVFDLAKTSFESWQHQGKFLYITCGKEDIGNIGQEAADFAQLLADAGPANLTWNFPVSSEKRHCPFTALHDGLISCYSR